MPSGFKVTDHAIQRYRERVERCSKRAATDRLIHAMSISVPATKRHLKYARMKDYRTTALYFRYCEVESLLLCCKYVTGGSLLVTVFRIPQAVPN